MYSFRIEREYTFVFLFKLEYLVLKFSRNPEGSLVIFIHQILTLIGSLSIFKELFSFRVTHRSAKNAYYERFKIPCQALLAKFSLNLLDFYSLNSLKCLIIQSKKNI